jgi:SAM-dependent methyltransferase
MLSPPKSSSSDLTDIEQPLSGLAREHLDAIRQHFDQAATKTRPLGKIYRQWLAHYYNLLIPKSASVLEIGCGNGELLSLLRATNVSGVDISETQISAARARLPDGKFFVQAGEEIDLQGSFDYIIVSDTLNLAADVQCLLARLHRVSHAETRLVLNYYSVLWQPLLSLATLCGLRGVYPQCSWLSATDIEGLLCLASWQQIKRESRILLPIKMLGLERFINRWIAPIFPFLCLVVFSIARPMSQAPRKDLRVSVIIPARNEGGTVEAAVRRVPQMGIGTEIIFVEGNSRDDTWQKIQELSAKFPEQEIVAIRQPGVGKGDAVRVGFAAATGDILMILDADLTVPPEELPKFYDVLASGHAEFANGVRLVYPMDKEAMRFFNLCANKFFSLAFSWLFGQPVKDTLCGTKVLFREQYHRIAQNREYFGNFDPFGDFDLLFGANKLSLKIADVPIRYRERVYGETNIRRWEHGLLLFKMLGLAACRLKFV